MLSAGQKKVLWVLLLVGLLYFAVFFLPNARGADDSRALSANGDENITYPYVVRMLTPGSTFNETRANLFLYEDYHYGYPFYAYSSLVVLPVRLALGQSFTQHALLNLLLLRQFVSVLPMIVAALLLVFMQTRFQSLWKSLALFVFLLSIRGVVRNHIWWWHPDAMTVLCVVLTLFFLWYDRLRFGRGFYLAALACGLATAIKLAGLFFFLTIPAYLLVGYFQRRLSLMRAVISAALFVLVMSAAVIFTNPFLFSDDQRARMVMIQTEKQQELSQGYTHDDPIYYSKGPQWWTSTLEKWYGQPLFLAFLFGSLVAGSLWGPNRFANRLILTWVVPYSIYLLYFVAVKPDHYWLPVMLPIFSSAFALFDLLRLPWAASFFRRPSGLWVRRAALALLTLVLVGQFVLNLVHPVSGNLPLYASYLVQGMPY